MTKIEEPATLLVAHRKKRSWSTTCHGRSPLFRHDRGSGGNNSHHHSRHDRHSIASSKLANKGALSSSHPPPPRRKKLSEKSVSMQSILERYHSLALTHYTQTKRRRLESAARSTQNSQRLEQLTSLHKMAQDTLNFCTEVLRSEEEHVRRENERERREVEEEMKRAEREKALAEDFLSRFGVGGEEGCGEGGATGLHDHHPRNLHHEEGEMANHAENIENDISGNSHRIGGIPSKFLDLSHFPKLRKSFHEGKGAKHDAFSSPDNNMMDGKDDSKMTHAIIDCTKESASPRRLSIQDNNSNAHHLPTRIPSFGVPPFGIPPEVALKPDSHNTNATQSKQNTKRIYISHASLSHVNGTYIQEGCYNDAPLFVRVGPPRKFMGKWDCSVVLRREEEGLSPAASSPKSMEEGGGTTTTTPSKPLGKKMDAPVDYVWKIGLVPAHRITHPRIIGYYAAKEDGSSCISNHPHNQAMTISPKRVSNIDRMEEDTTEAADHFYDDDEEESSMYYEPPVEGWRVFQENNVVGRASSLKVSYEE